MECLRQTISSTRLSNIFNLPPALRGKRVDVIIIPAESNDIEEEQPNYECKLDFVRGSELPESFFDPLPEEELQAWRL